MGLHMRKVGASRLIFMDGKKLQQGLSFEPLIKLNNNMQFASWVFNNVRGLFELCEDRQSNDE